MKPKLQYFSQGSAVKELQSKLNDLLPNALPKLVMDGKFGDKTLARVKEFQRSRGLIPDGIVGAQTWAALDGAAPPKAGAPKPPPSPTPGDKVKTAAGAGIKVHQCALLFCDCGTQPSMLLLDDPVVGIATVNDCKPLANIMPFGHCMSEKNPTMGKVQNPLLGEEAAPVATIPGQCLPQMSGHWTAGKSKEKVGGKEALDRTSTIKCKWGGIIRIL